VLDAFLMRTGRPALPPDWIFEPWMSANDWNTQQRVLDEVGRGAAADIPVGVVVIEAWSDESTFTAFRDAVYEPHPDGSPHTLADFTFPADGAWPDPKALVEELHDRGIRLLLWQIPLLKAAPTPGSQLDYDRRALVDRGYAVRKADGSPYANRGWWFPRALLPDFTSAEVRAWWTAKRRYLVEELGIDGFKTDGGEHAWGSDLRYADGTRGAETNNRYPVLYAAAYHELMHGLGRQGMTFSRAGFTGSAAYPCHWAGDEDSTWQAFRASITAGLTAGACGIFFWGWDLAGFSGELPTAELYMRSAATACFAPIMQYHSEYHHRTPSRDRTPWNVAEQTRDPRVLEVYRRFAQLRMRLQPYLRAQARVSVAAGKPLMRALFFEFPDDPRIWDFPYTYLLGDDLLVAPVVEPGTEEQRVYLPDGEWIDPWTSEHFVGPIVVTCEAPLDRIPVYVTARGATMLVDLFKTDGD
jgi:alpha-glucosidase (family GH31 glycosyl hydrolase)